MAPTNREIELKLEGSKAALERLRQSDLLGSLEAEDLGSERLTSIYFDTPDLALAQQGVALRIRRENGHFVQTIKASRGATGPHADRLELDVPVESTEPVIAALPEPALEALLRETQAKLRPIFETDVKRHSLRVRLAGGELVEMAIDLGAIRRDKLRQPIAEVELELLDGAPEALYALADPLVNEFSLRLSKQSKAERGYRLQEPSFKAPRPASPVAAFSSVETLGQAWQGLHAYTAERLVTWAGELHKGDQVMAIHQLRVTLRRYRSGLKLFRPFLRAEDRAALDQDGGPIDLAKRFADAFGTVRDGDVTLATFLAPLREDPRYGAGALPLCALLEAQRAQALRRAQALVASQPFNGFIVGLMKPTAAVRKPKRAWRPLMDQTLEKRFSKLGPFLETFSALSIDERHWLRRRLKEQRYFAEFTGHLYGKKAVRAYHKAAKRLQEDIGAGNDRVVALALLERVVTSAQRRKPLEPAAAEALAYLRGRLEALGDCSETDLARSVSAFVDTRPYWRV